MLVFWKEKLVFLSVPKTGTTAYEKALSPLASMTVLDPPELKHAPLYRYNRFFRPMFEKACKTQMETMAVMREPVSWLGSWYRYRQRPFMEGKPNSTHEVSFDDFVSAYCQEKPPGFANVGSQAKFLEPRPNGTSIDHLFRYEDQSGLIAFLENRLSIKLDLPRENVSPKMDLLLSTDVETELRQARSEEFELWNSISA
ncbi:sulfotransferase family 2 domain-containing protein [Thalassovita gelatinovora]|nr:sulfotransferase family 2 domain-containing protein [Thalassovita gelatinovora]QIZ79010.1 gamma-glutamyl kinase [Thalassovita gelatinovora]